MLRSLFNAQNMHLRTHLPEIKPEFTAHLPSSYNWLSLEICLDMNSCRKFIQNVLTRVLFHFTPNYQVYIQTGISPSCKILSRRITDWCLLLNWSVYPLKWLISSFSTLQKVGSLVFSSHLLASLTNNVHITMSHLTHSTLFIAETTPNTFSTHWDKGCCCIMAIGPLINFKSLVTI